MASPPAVCTVANAAPSPRAPGRPGHGRRDVVQLQVEKDPVALRRQGRDGLGAGRPEQLETRPSPPRTRAEAGRASAQGRPPGRRRRGPGPAGPGASPPPIAASRAGRSTRRPRTHRREPRPVRSRHGPGVASGVSGAATVPGGPAIPVGPPFPVGRPCPESRRRRADPARCVASRPGRRPRPTAARPCTAPTRLRTSATSCTRHHRAESGQHLSRGPRVAKRRRAHLAPRRPRPASSRRRRRRASPLRRRRSPTWGNAARQSWTARTATGRMAGPDRPPPPGPSRGGRSAAAVDGHAEHGVHEHQGLGPGLRARRRRCRRGRRRWG